MVPSPITQSRRPAHNPGSCRWRHTERTLTRAVVAVPSPTVHGVPDFHIYEPLDAPDVEVAIDGQWWPGEARMRTTHDDGRLSYNVRWHREGMTYLDNFSGERVRLDTINRRGRRGQVARAGEA
jgi:hypothetical protein